MIQNIDPIFFSIGPIHIRYYGIFYMLSFMFIYTFLAYVAKKKIIGHDLSKKNIEDYIFFLIIWTVIGSRLFEALFYNWHYFMMYPWKIFAVWEGGLSFHGGLLAFVLYSLYFCRRHRVPFLLWLDMCSIPVALGLSLGRFANFLNGELYGFPVTNQIDPPFWSVLFVRTDPLKLYRYPTQLWESLSNLILFIILLSVFIWMIRRNKLPLRKGGLLVGIFGVIYSLFRFIVEYWKDYEQDILFNLSMGQLLCIPLFIMAILVLIYYAYFQRKKA